MPQTLVLAEAQPGIFTANEQGFGQGEIYQSDDVTLAQPGTSAAIGDFVVILLHRPRSRIAARACGPIRSFHSSFGGHGESANSDHWGASGASPV